MRLKLFVVLMEGCLATERFAESKNDEKVALVSSTNCPRLVLDRTKLQIGIVQLTENMIGRMRHFTLHRQQILFLLGKSMLAITHDPLEDRSIKVSLKNVRLKKLIHRRLGNRQDLGTNKASQLG